MQTKLPPQALEIEESILASCFMGEGGDVASYLMADDFYKTANKIIFSVIMEMIEKNESVDLLSITQKLKDFEKLDSIGGATYLAEISNSIPPSTSLKHYARIIKEKAVLRELINKSHQIIELCYSSSDNTAEIVDKAQKSIFEVELWNGKKTGSTYKSLILDSEERYSDKAKRKGPTGILSGYRLLDIIMAGFQKSDLITLAGRPSMGKSAMVINFTRATGRAGIPIVIFSLEMSEEQIIDRQVAIESGVNLQKFRTGEFEPEDWKKISYAKSKIFEWPAYIEDEGALHYLEIKRRLRKYVKNHGVKMCIIDHLQLVRGDNSPSRDREIGGITASLKAAAKELDIPIILLSQLNRQLESRINPHKRPKLSDLRDSGNIEQDSDCVIFLYRPEVYGDIEEFPGHAELIVTKQRNGPTGLVKLLWKPKTTAFESVAYPEEREK